MPPENTVLHPEQILGHRFHLGVLAKPPQLSEYKTIITLTLALNAPCPLLITELTLFKTNNNDTYYFTNHEKIEKWRFSNNFRGIMKSHLLFLRLYRWNQICFCFTLITSRSQNQSILKSFTLILPPKSSPKLVIYFMCIFQILFLTLYETNVPITQQTVYGKQITRPASI